MTLHAQPEGISELRCKSDESINSRARILSAATLLIAKHGIANCTVREIKRQTGLSIAAIYYHFNSKEDLYLEVIQNVIDKILIMADAHRRYCKDPSQRLAILIDECLQLLSEDKSSYLLIRRDMTEMLARGRPLFSSRPYYKAIRLLERIGLELAGRPVESWKIRTVGTLILGICDVAIFSSDFKNEAITASVSSYKAQLMQQAVGVLMCEALTTGVAAD